MPEVSTNRIAFVSPEGDLFTINPDGSDPRKITGDLQATADIPGHGLARVVSLDEIYAWPTWSPDGTKLAASRVRVSGNDLEISVQLVDLTTGRQTTLFTNDIPGLIADQTPHYLYWAPDSDNLAVLASTPQGLTLFVVDTTSPGSPTPVRTGAPLYFHWRGGGDSIVVHTAGHMQLLARPFARPGPTIDVGNAFRVAAFSPDGGHIAYVSSSEEGSYLEVADVTDLGNPRRVVELEGLSAFTWSPDGQELAVADQQDPRSPALGRLRIVSPDGGPLRTIAEEPLLAFYWSPTGDDIAWVGLNTEEELFTLKAAASSGESLRELFQFQPSSEVLTMLTFFDQYVYSHSPWSPDGTRLVIAGSLAPPSDRSGNGHTPTGDRVFVIDASGGAEPQEIAPGTLAFWSWN